MSNPHFGCGPLAMRRLHVHVDGVATRLLRDADLEGRGQEIVTLQGLGTPEKPHPLADRLTSRSSSANAATASTAGS